MGAAFTARRMAASFAIFAGFAVFWWWGPELLRIPPYFIPSLPAVLDSIVELQAKSDLAHHALITWIQMLLGFLFGALFGMVAGYFLGMSVSAEVVLSPYILALQIAPKVAFAPLFVLWLGFGQGPRILTAALIVFFPILINVMTAVRNVDLDLINLARSFRATRLQIFWRIEFPASMPPLFAGLRIGATLAVIGVTVGEFVGGNEGLGVLLTIGAGSAETSVVFAAIIAQTVLGILLYFLVVLAERRVLHYMPNRGLESF